MSIFFCILHASTSPSFSDERSNTGKHARRSRKLCLKLHTDQRLQRSRNNSNSIDKGGASSGKAGQCRQDLRLSALLVRVAGSVFDFEQELADEG